MTVRPRIYAGNLNFCLYKRKMSVWKLGMWTFKWNVNWNTRTESLIIVTLVEEITMVTVAECPTCSRAGYVQDQRSAHINTPTDNQISQYVWKRIKDPVALKAWIMTESLRRDWFDLSASPSYVLAFHCFKVCLTPLEAAAERIKSQTVPLATRTQTYTTLCVP